MENAKRKIKVLFFQEPAGGGSLIALYEMLKELDTEKIEPVVVCYYKSKYTRQLENINNCRVYYADENIEFHRNNGSSSKNRLLNILLIQYNSLKKYFGFEKKLAKYFLEIIQYEKPDILHHNNDIAVNRSAIRAGVKSKVPQVLYNHGLPVYRFNIIEYIVDYFLLRKIHYHLHLTHAIEDHYKKTFHLSLSHSSVMHSFVDRGFFKPGDSSLALKNKFGISDDEIVISNVGRITHWKGQHVLIEALKIIKDDLSNFKVLMVGSYEKGVGSENYFNQLKGLVCKYQLHKQVIFTGNRSDIHDIMNASDVIVHTAVRPEPQGIVILEAQLCHKTVIASNDAGSAELIKKYGGILFEPGSANELAAILLKLFKNNSADIATRYACKYEQLDSDFNSSKKAKQILDIYKGCLQAV